MQCNSVHSTTAILVKNLSAPCYKWHSGTPIEVKLTDCSLQFSFHAQFSSSGTWVGKWDKWLQQIKFNKSTHAVSQKLPDERMNAIYTVDINYGVKTDKPCKL